MSGKGESFFLYYFLSVIKSISVCVYLNKCISVA